MIKQMTCIVCPIGCRLTIEVQDDLIVSGNKCKRGQAYARSELTEPKRMVTGTVRVCGQDRLLPVKTSVPIRKELIFECLEQLKAVTVTPPVSIGDIIIQNVLKSGVDIVATKNADKE